ncbi:flavin-containing monooxygenase [Peribacillus asahii]|uniref:Oxidoreductase n=1 Tax=Peribacillus asahii TaxID=228899 RepID=A0A3Q9RMP9_9BACI|nr:NAD(P)/FAD-dependent oxidoreductase [Peribacillus asahii]AZV43060.1 oxidoreductase [Peribacillus asahii]USK83176.1 NAD(P)/FAD-dependent oxidoreductase [Peribacillus asahii]
MKYNVIIIGAGQAGLSMGYYLQQTDLSFLILDKGEEIGAVWKNRYDSLKLFTPRSYSSLPGLALEGNQSVYPTKDEIAKYLSFYAEAFSLPVKLRTIVQGLYKDEDSFRILTDKGEILAENVVIAAGPFQNSFIPEFAKTLSNNVLQLHSSQYKNSKQLRDGPVLVVGGGNSGAQIAVELSKQRETHLSVNHKMKFLPQSVMNKSIFWWFDKLGIYTASVNTKVGQYIKNNPDPIFGFELKSLIKSGKVILKPRTISIQNDNIIFEDNSEVHVNNVIWSTGFVSDYRWIDIADVLDEKSQPIHQRGITSIDGLYFLGLPWQYSRGSALLQGVGVDAEYLIKYILDKS